MLDSSEPCTTCGRADCGCCAGGCHNFTTDDECGRCGRRCSGADFCQDCGSGDYCCTS